MADYHRFLSDRGWYRDSIQPTTRSPSSSPDITSTANWSYRYDLLAIAEPKMDTRITLPSHGPCCPSRRHALRELSQYAQQSEALEPSDTDDDLAPEPRSLNNPVTPTKPSSRENQTLADAPKKSQKVTRNFSEADLQDPTPSKRPKLSTRPSIVSQSPEIAAVEKTQSQSQSPLPTSLRPASHSNGPTSRATMQEEEGSRRQSDINDNLKDPIVAGMGRMQITSSLASLDGYVYIHDPQVSAKLKQTEWKLRHLLSSEDGKVRTYDAEDSSESETDGIETTPSLSSEDGKARTHDAQDSSEAKTDEMKTTPSFASEDEEMRIYDAEDSSEAETDRMMTTPSLASGNEKVRTYNPQDSGEAETDQKELTPSLGGEIIYYFGYDEIMY